MESRRPAGGVMSVRLRGDPGSRRGPEQQAMTVAISRNHFDLRRQLPDPPQVMMAAVPRIHINPVRDTAGFCTNLNGCMQGNPSRNCWVKSRLFDTGGATPRDPPGGFAPWTPTKGNALGGDPRGRALWRGSGRSRGSRPGIIRFCRLGHRPGRPLSLCNHPARPPLARPARGVHLCAATLVGAWAHTHAPFPDERRMLNRCALRS
jgi:hypothetical protein